MTMQHLDRSQLERYAHGHVLGAEAHALETHLERCALCREAVEGLAERKTHLPLLENTYGTSGSTWLRPALIVVAVVGVIAVPWLLPSHDDEALLTTRQVESEATPQPDPALEDKVQGTLVLPTETEIAAAVQIVPELQIGHELVKNKPPLKADDVVVQRDTVVIPQVEPLEVRTAPVDTVVKRAERDRVDTRKLVFLHDLKLVHPDELYGSADPPISDLGVSARFASPEDQDAADPGTRPVQYLDHFDAALAAFKRNDHKRALTDLRIVLSQYPDDINAIFYAGLSCYNLGLYAKAEQYFARVAVHPVRTFDEEARWYQALSIERSEGAAAAKPIFVDIASGSGFYAAQAFGRLK